MLHGYKICAVFISRIHEEVLREFIEALGAAFRPHGWRVMVFCTGSDLFWHTASDHGQESIFDLPDPAILDALVIMRDKVLDADCFERLCSRAVAAGLPTFVLNGTHPGCCCIDFDHAAGFASVVEHLVTHHGIRSFHFISGMRDNAFAKTREDVMRSVLAAHGIPFTDADISYGDFWSEPARQAVRRLIEEDRLPRAVVCANDTMAIAVAVELNVHGYRVPQDVIVTGYDGIDAIRYSIPKITSAKSDYSLLARTVARLAVERLDDLPARIDLVPELLCSESCGCVPRAEMDVVDFINNINDSFNRFRNEDEKLGELSALIQGAETPAAVSQIMHDNNIFYCMSCLIKRECLDFSLDPAKIWSETAFGEEMYVLLDSDWHDNEGTWISVRGFVPRLKDMLDFGVPVVFIAICQVDVPLGYLCFHFETIEAQNVVKIYQSAMAVGNAVAGFRNRHYQQHLRAVMEDAYRYDALTGLYTRSAFLRRLARMESEETVEHRTLVLCDLDGLKFINDHFSHTEGDNAIAVAADALHEACHDGLCCRYGGDEMLALLPYAADAEVIRRRILTQLAAYNKRSRKPYRVSVSIGIYVSPNEGFEAMFQKADTLMYTDKSTKPHKR